MHFIVLLMFWTLDVVVSSTFANVCKTPAKYVDATISVAGYGGCNQLFALDGVFNGFPWSTATCASFSTEAQKNYL